jgi:L,D-transpeptidase YbiS
MRDVLIHVSLAEQRLEWRENGETVAVYPVSTARNGPGERRGSGCTPRGWHRIRIKIGAGLPLDTVFVGRRPSGEIYTPELALRHPERDWILTRILWLTGLESGHNRGGDRDTLRRFIYIHGCPDAEPIGAALSHGCIRMRNRDLLALFDRVEAGDRVFIADDLCP